MKKPIWKHSDNLYEDLQNLNVIYCAGRDVKSLPPADEELIEYDLWTNFAHSFMLYKCNIINKTELTYIFKALYQIYEDYKNRKFKLNPQLEDVHINIESKISELIGEKYASKIHTARSRNDQITTDLRLYTRANLLIRIKELIDLCKVLINKLDDHIDDVMPGITHFQPATVTTYSHFLASYIQAFLRDIGRGLQIFERFNINPLGAAASYGTSWNIDRSITTYYLGFYEVQENSLDVITNRWEFETEFVSFLSFIFSHLNIISQDLILFSSPYVGYIVLPNEFVTGSSIMPQKRNPDFAEVTRAKASYIYGSLQTLFSIVKGCNSGYNRDTQWIKYIIIDTVRESNDALIIFSQVFKRLSTNSKIMLKRCQVGFINAVEFADYIAKEKNVGFRKAYNIISKVVNRDFSKNRITFETLQKYLNEYNIKLSYEEYQNLSDYRKIVNLKNSCGGPAKIEIFKQKEKFKRILDEYEKKHNEYFCFVENRRKELFKFVNEVIEK